MIEAARDLAGNDGGLDDRSGVSGRLGLRETSVIARDGETNCDRLLVEPEGGVADVRSEAVAITAGAFGLVPKDVRAAVTDETLAVVSERCASLLIAVTASGRFGIRGTVMAATPAGC